MSLLQLSRQSSLLKGLIIANLYHIWKKRSPSSRVGFIHPHERTVRRGAAGELLASLFSESCSTEKHVRSSLQR
jgi:hypothetical protein